MTMTMMNRPKRKKRTVTTEFGMSRPVPHSARLRRSPASRVMFACVALFMVSALCSPLAGSDKNLQKHYGLIFGTAYGPDDQPLYGVRVRIHPAGGKHPSWDLITDHRGEFAQRVPPGPGDYLITGEAELLLPGKDDPHHTQKKRVKAEAKVHLEGEERQDLSLHLIN